MIYQIIHPIVIAGALLQSAVSIGAILLVVSAYVHDERFAHVALVGTGCMLMIALVTHSLCVALYMEYPWRLPVAITAFACIDLSLWKYWKKARLRLREKNHQ